MDANMARSMPSASRSPIINASSTRSCPATRVVSAVPWPSRSTASSQASGPLARRVARLACALGEPAMRARPDADVILIPPIDQIMAAGSPRPGVVGDFVGGQAGGREPRLGELEHRRRLVLGRQGEGAARMVGEEARAALDGELIERQVLAGQRQRPLELGRPGLRGLAGPGIDQVEGIAREMPARRGDAPRAPRRRNARGRGSAATPASSACTPSDTRLTPASAQRGEAAGLDRGRVGLERDLDVGRACPTAPSRARSRRRRSRAPSARACRRRRTSSRRAGPAPRARRAPAPSAARRASAPGRRRRGHGN